MDDPYPSLPPHDYATSRALRLGVFCLVVATLLVSLFVVIFRFLWDAYLRDLFNQQAPYQARIEFLLPAILLVTLVLFVRLRDASKDPALRARQRRGTKPG